MAGPALSPVHRSKLFDSIESVRVASWPDGAQLVRNQLSIGSTDPLARSPIYFEFWNSNELIGFCVESSETQPNSPVLRMLNGSETILNMNLKKIRWALTQIGVFPRYHSPVLVRSYRYQTGDPVIAKLLPRDQIQTKKDSLAVLEKMSPTFMRGLSGFKEAFRITDDPSFQTDVKLDSPPGLLIVTFRSGGRYLVELSSAVGIRNADTTSLFTKMVLDREETLKKGYLLLYEDELERWFDDNREPGEISLPHDEAEVFEILGEKHPMSWSGPLLSRWADDRWPMS